MGLQSAMTTALTGLQAAETTIDIVGNNVANSQTVGFKESEAVFATQFLQTLSIGSAPTASGGGTNPKQIGLGVKVAEISPNFTQGTIEISSNILDVAIQGDGFLIVQSGTGDLYTRNGQLKLNADNDVVTTTGQRLVGYTVDENFQVVTDNLVPLNIPLGKERVAQSTENATMAGVLNPAVEAGDEPEIIESLVLGNAAIEAPDDTNFDGTSIITTDTPDPATATETGAGVGPDAGLVRYRIAFLDDVTGGESSFSTEFTVNNTVAGTIDLTNIPVADGVIFTNRAIYRTEADGSTFYRVADIGDAVTTTYTDTMDDATLVGNPVMDATNIEAGSYSYYVTYYNPSTGVETRPTARVAAPAIANTGGGRMRIDLDDVGAPIDASFTQMRIYRNIVGESSNFRLLAEVPSQADVGNYESIYIDSIDNTTLALGSELNLDGPPAVSGNLLTEVIVRSGDVYMTPFEEGVLSFAGEKDGVSLSEKELTIEATTTVQNLIDFMRDALGIDQESSLSTIPFPQPIGNVEIVNGQLRVTSNMGEENAIDIPLTAFKITPTGEQVNSTIALNFNATQTANGPGTSSEFIAYDSLGLPVSVRVTTVLESKDNNSTTYRWYATSPNNQPVTGLSTVVGDGVLIFDSNGDLDDQNPTARLSIFREGTASESPLEITLDFSTVKALGETDPQGNPISTLNVTNQDGFPPGVLNDFIITEDGTIQGQFSNGTQRTVGQIVMARFSNSSGLQQVGDSMYATGVNSGNPIYGSPGEEGIGALNAGAVELSNTDIGQNLIELILASTQYRGGARVISAAQELLDELLALRR